MYTCIHVCVRGGGWGSGVEGYMYWCRRWGWAGLRAHEGVYCLMPRSCDREVGIERVWMRTSTGKRRVKRVEFL